MPWITEQSRGQQRRFASNVQQLPETMLVKCEMFMKMFVESSCVLTHSIATYKPGSTQQRCTHKTATVSVAQTVQEWGNRLALSFTAPVA